MHVSARGVIFIDNKVVLIHRRKQREDGSMRDFYVVPGGKSEEGETLEETVIREIKEELGIDVVPKEKILEQRDAFNNSIQNYFLCEYQSGTLGTGNGPEFQKKLKNGEPFQIELVDIEDLKKLNLISRKIKNIILKYKKRAYSYYIIKPDGIRRFKEIYDMLQENFAEVRFFKIDDFATTIKRLYYMHYYKKGIDFAENFDQYLYSSEGLYGNKAILAIVADQKRERYAEFRKRVFRLKKKLRETFSNPYVRILSNAPTKAPWNYITVHDENGNEIKQRSFMEKGNYRINELNAIHCPDSDQETTEEELRILLAEGIISDENLISGKALEELLRFRTLEGFQHDDDEIRPDIAGFVQYDLKDSLGER